MRRGKKVYNFQATGWPSIPKEETSVEKSEDAVIQQNKTTENIAKHETTENLEQFLERRDIVPDCCDVEKVEQWMNNGKHKTSSPPSSISSINSRTKEKHNKDGTADRGVGFYFRPDSHITYSQRTSTLQYNGTGSNSLHAAICDYKDTSWCIGVPIEFATDGECYMVRVYSYQNGLEIIEIDSTNMSHNMTFCCMIKYKYDSEIKKHVLIPLLLSLPSVGLITMKVRYNKSVELKLYALCNFVDFERDENASTHESIMWTDAIGAIRISGSERQETCRKIMVEEAVSFAPLRLCNIKIRGDIIPSSLKEGHPEWQITSIQEIIEEVDEDTITLGTQLWPDRILRYDDLVMHQKKKVEGEYFFQSYSHPEVNVIAKTNLEGIIFSAGNRYAENGVMTGLVFPIYGEKEVNYEALIIGPLNVVMMVTEGRLLNYGPVSWTPKVEERIKQYKNKELHRTKKKELDDLCPPFSYKLEDLMSRHEILPKFARTLRGSYELIGL